MKLAVFRYATSGQPDRILGLVDAEGEAVMSGQPLPPENRPHEYDPPESAGDHAVELRTGPLCRCGKPQGHQVHVRPPDDAEPDDGDEGMPGPIPVTLYDPVELYTMVVPTASPVDPSQRGLAVVTVPELLPQSYVVVHYERMLWDGLYDLDPEPGEEPEDIVADYKAAVEMGRAKAQATGRVPPPPASGGRRRVVS
jgi:hypothetical protein